MSGKRSEAELEFFLTGAKTYLDVEDALAEFRRQVQGRCRAVVKERLPDICCACQMEWTTDDLQDYKEGGGPSFLGVKISLEVLGGVCFYFGMEREDNNQVYGIWVQLWRKRRSLAPALWALMEATETANTEYSANSLYFGCTLSEEQVPEFEEYLNRGIDLFLDFITKAGGLKKYLQQQE